MSGLDHAVAALTAAQVLANADATIEQATIDLGIAVADLQAQISVGQVIVATVLPPQNGVDYISLLGQNVPAQLPPGINPGEAIAVQVTGFHPTTRNPRDESWSGRPGQSPDCRGSTAGSNPRCASVRPAPTTTDPTLPVPTTTPTATSPTAALPSALPAQSANLGSSAGELLQADFLPDCAAARVLRCGVGSRRPSLAPLPEVSCAPTGRSVVRPSAAIAQCTTLEAPHRAQSNQIALAATTEAPQAPAAARHC